MKIRQIRIENFRSFKDETIRLDDYTCLVGPNGAGKSAVLTALNVFFRNNASTSTDVHTLSEEDFHLRNTKQPVKITLTFDDLSGEAQKDLKAYYRQGQLVVSAKAEWDDKTRTATVIQYGSRTIMKDFIPFFGANENKAKAADLKEIYTSIRESFPDLPGPSTKTANTDALRAYEESHPELCDLIDSPLQFYGWAQGNNLLNKYIQWVYVPAVKDAATEQEEGTKTALGQLLKRTIRSKVDFENSLSDLKEEIETKYESIIEKQQAILDGIELTIQHRLREWTNDSARLLLKWDYDRDKSLIINEPFARVKIGEDEFIGEVPRIGHGMQRAFLVSILQELATSQLDSAPTLVLGFEEPELYQHPPQAQHIADILVDLAKDDEKKTQVVVTTHSPYFASGKDFEFVRMVRKNPKDKHTTVVGTTYKNVQDAISDALGEEPSCHSRLMATVEQIMHPSQRELFFAPFSILLEGWEDIAFISTHMHITKKWSMFRKLGCHFVVAEGKSNMSRLLAIANKLNIPAFVVFDADADQTQPGDEKKNKKDNSCILKLCSKRDFDPLPSDILWGNNVVMWPTEIAKVVHDDFGQDIWQKAQDKARKDNGFTGVSSKNRLLIAATLEELHQQSVHSSILDKLSHRILSFAKGLPPN